MANTYEFGLATKQNPVDTGIENARNTLEDSLPGHFKISDNDFSTVSKILREIWDENLESKKIKEEFASPLFELVALTQFYRIQNGDGLWDKVELERLTDSIWEIIERWLKPSTPKK